MVPLQCDDDGAKNGALTRYRTEYSLGVRYTLANACGPGKHLGAVLSSLSHSERGCQDDGDFRSYLYFFGGIRRQTCLMGWGLTDGSRSQRQGAGVAPLWIVAGVLLVVRLSVASGLLVGPISPSTEAPQQDLYQVPYNGNFTFTRIRYGSGGAGRGFGWGWSSAWNHDYPVADLNMQFIL